MSDRPPYKLRDDLIISKRVFAGQVKYMVKDPLRMQYFTLAPVGYELLSLCDGRRDVGTLLRLARKKLPNMRMDAEKLVNFYESFRKLHYLEDAWQRNVMLIEKRRRSRETKKSLQPGQVNLWAFDPDRLLDRIVGPLGFMFTRRALVAYALIVGAALFMIFTHLEEFEISFAELWTIPGTPFLGLVVLWAALLSTALLHELGHGLTCKRFGGEVHRIGVMLLYFSPCFFADVTESLFFEKKAHKQAVTAAGGIVNLLTSSLATFVWFFTSPDLWINQLCHRVAIYSGVSTVLINLNPLSRFDGYYLLSTHLDLPDLQRNSYRELGKFFRKLLGLPVDDKPISTRERRIYLIWGILSCVYLATAMTLIYLAITRWLVGAWRAAGYVAAGLLLLKMSARYRRGFFNFVRFAAISKADHLRRHRRPYLIAAGALALVLALVPLPRHVTGEFRLRPVREAALRAPEAGVIEAIFAVEGDTVRAGAPVLAVAQERIGLSRGRAAAERAGAEAEAAAATVRGDAATAASRRAEAGAAAAWERYEVGRGDRLAVVAPFEAVVLSARMIEKVGMPCAPGDTLCELGDLSALRAEVQLDELVLGILETHGPVELRLASPPWQVVRGRVLQVASEAGDGDVRKRYRVQVEIEDPKRTLMPGMSGTARFAARPASALEQVGGMLARILRIEFWI
jgi:putative peptide zinc metalloprotease protein